MGRPVFYLGLVISIVSLLCFADLSGDMTDAGWGALEDSIAFPIHHLRGPWLNLLMRGLTILGSFWFLSLVVLLVLLWPRFSRRDKAVLLSLGVLEGLLNGFFKSWFGRPRPGIDYAPLVEEKYFSFPSGHSMGSLCVYGFLAYLLCRHYPSWRWPASLLALLVIFSVGFSRIYLAAHYPGDVAGGFAAGVPCLFVAIVVHQGLVGQRNVGSVEKVSK